MGDDRNLKRADGRVASIVGLAAIAAGGAYLTWRVTATLDGAPPALAMPFLAVELWAFILLALHVVELWTTPGRPAPPPDPGGRDGPELGIDLLVDAAGASPAALARTLVGCGQAIGARNIVVVDDRPRVGISPTCVRHGAELLVIDDAQTIARLAAAAATSDADAIVWLDAGQIPMPELLEAARPLLADPTTAVVQSAVGIYNSDSLVHLASGRDEQAFRDDVVGPALDRWRCAPWFGGGSVVRVAALTEIADAPSTARGAVRLHRAGHETRFVARPLVRASAPDVLSDYLADHTRRAEAALGMLVSRDTPLLGRRLPWRARLAHVTGALKYLSGVARLTIVAVLVASLLSGRVPIAASAPLVLLWWAVAGSITAAAWCALGRGRIRLGDRTRQSLRTMGAYTRATVNALCGRSTRRGASVGARGGVAVLGELPLLTLSNLALEAAIVVRAATLRWPGLLPAFTTDGRLVVLVASLATAGAMTSVLRCFVRRTQRRDAHRLAVDLPVSVDGVPARATDLTPGGVGIDVAVPSAASHGDRVRVGFDLPRLDGTTYSITVAGVVRHGHDDDGATRLGIELFPDDAARDLLVEYCGITYHVQTLSDADSQPVFVTDDLAVTTSDLHRVALRVGAIVTFLLGLAVLVFGPAPATALTLPTVTWSGGGATNNWTDTGNWVGGAVPTASQTAVLDTNVKNVTINASISVGGISVTSNYTGTITQSGAFTITLGADGFTMAGGTFTGGSGNITMNGAFTQTGGAFTTTSGTTTFNQPFNQSNGTFTSSSGTVNMASTFTLSNGTFTAPNAGGGGGGPFASPQLQLRSTVSISGGTFNPSNGTVALVGGTFTWTGSLTVYNLTHTSGTVTLASGTTITATGTTTLTAGTLNGSGTLAAHGAIAQGASYSGGSATLLIAGSGAQTLTGAANGTPSLPQVVINKPAGTLTLAGSIRTASNWTYTAGTVSAGGTFVAAGTFTISGSQSFGNFSQTSGALTIANGSTVSVTSALTLTGGSLAGGTLDATGAIGEGSGYGGGAGTLRVSGSGAQTFTGSATTAAGALPVVVINKPAGTLTLSGTIRTANSWTLTAGTVDPSTSTFVIAGAMTITGTESFNHVTHTAGALTIANGSAVTVGGTLTLTGGSLASGTLDATGPLVENSGYGGGAGTLRISGSGAQTFTGSATTAAGALPIVVINKPAGTLTLSGTIRTANSWTLSSGTLDAGTSMFVTAGTLTITGTQTFNDVNQMAGNLTIANGSTATATGSLTLTAGSLASGALDAAGAVTITSGYSGGAGTLRISGSGAQSFTNTSTASTGLMPALVVNKPAGTVSLTGTFRTASSWTVTAGALDAGTSMLVIVGNVTITGSQSLYALQQTSSTTTVANGSTVTVSGPLALNGGTLVGTLDAAADIAVGGSYGGGTGTLRISGVGPQAFSDASNGSSGALPGVNIAKPSGTVTLSGTFRTANPWALTSGTMDAGTSTLVVSNSMTISGAPTFFNVTQAGGTLTLAAGSNVTATGALNLTTGNISGTLSATGDINAASTHTGGESGTLRITGPGSQTLTGSDTSSTGSLPTIVIDKPSGTLTLAGQLRIMRNWTLTNGTLNAASSLLYVGNSITITGTQAFNDVNQTANNLTIANGSIVTVGGTLTLTGGTIASGTLDAAAAVVETSGYGGGAGNLRLSGAGNQTLTGSATSSAGLLPNLVIDKSAGTLTLVGTLRTNRDWTVVNGTIMPGSSTVIVGAGSSTSTLHGVAPFHDLDEASGTFTVASDGTVSADGTLTLRGTVNVNTGGALTSTGTLALHSGTVTSGTVTVIGAITQTSGYSGGAGTLRIAGTANQNFAGSATTTTGSLPTVVIDKPSGTLTLAGTIRTTRDWTYTNGALDAATSTLVLGGSLTLSGDPTLGGLWFQNGTVVIPGGTDVTVMGTTTLQNGFQNGAGTIHARGDVLQSGQTNDGGTATLAIDGTGDQTFTGTGVWVYADLPVVRIDKPSGTLYLAGTIASSHDWTHVQGTVDPGTSVVWFDGNSDTISAAGMSFYDLHIASAPSRTVLGADLHVARDLGIADSAVLDTAGYAVHVGRDLNVDSTLQPGSSSFVFDGTTASTLRGNVLPALANLVVDDAAGVTLGDDLTLTGTLTLTTGDLRVGARTLSLAAPINGAVDGLVADASSTIVVAGSNSGITVPGGDLGRLTVANTAGAVVAAPLVVHTTLDLTGGPVVATSGLTVASGGTVNRTTGWVVGPLGRNVTGAQAVVFPVGGDAVAAAPVTLTPTSVTTPGIVTVDVTDGIHDDLVGAVIDPDRRIAKWWKFGFGSAQLGGVTADVTWADSDRVGGIAPATVLAQRRSGGAWYAETVSNATTTSAQVTLGGSGDLVLGGPGDADLGVDVSAPANADSGVATSATVTIANAGPAAASGVVAVIGVPAGATSIAAVPSAGTCSTNGTTITCSVGEVAANGQQTVALTFTPSVAGDETVAAMAAGDQLDLDPANSADVATIAVRGRADVGVDLTASASVLVEQAVSATVTFTNHGPDVAHAATVTIVAPAGATGIAAVPSAGSCSASGVTITCTLGTVAADASMSIAVGYTPTVPGDAELDATAGANEIDATSSNDTASATTSVQGVADLAVAVNAPASADSGVATSMTVTVTNAGPTDGSGVVLAIGAPTGATAITAQPSAGSCSGSGTARTCTMATVPVGGQASVVVTFTPNVAGDETVAAMVAGDQVDPDIANSSGIATIAVRGRADVDVDASAPPTALVGQPIAATVTFSNHGPDVAHAATATIVVPGGATGVAALPGAGSCATTGSTITCSLGTVAAGDDVAILVGFTPAGVGSAPLLADGSADEIDATPDNATSVSTNVQGVADLQVQIRVPATAALDREIAAQIVVTNRGPGLATGAVVVVTIPDAASTVDATTANGSCAFDAPQLTCSVGSIAAGDASTIAVTLAFSRDTVATIAASVSADQVDLVGRNNDVSVKTTITPPTTTTTTTRTSGPISPSTTTPGTAPRVPTTAAPVTTAPSGGSTTAPSGHLAPSTTVASPAGPSTTAPASAPPRVGELALDARRRHGDGVTAWWTALLALAALAGASALYLGLRRRRGDDQSNARPPSPLH